MINFSLPNLTRTLLPLAITAILASPVWSQEVFTVSDLSPRTTEKQIRELFKPYGEVLLVELKPTKDQGRRKGAQKRTAQVAVKKGKDARSTAKRLNRLMLDGSTIIVSISREPDRQDFKARARQGISREPDRQD